MWSLVVAATRHTNSADLVILIVLVLIGFQVWRRRSMGGGGTRGPFGGGGGPFGGSGGPGGPDGPGSF
jgi:hypothetical protein